MSYQWSFQSFSFDKFNAIFGSGTSEAKVAVLEAVTWDEGEWKDLSLVEKVVTHIVNSGVNYHGLSAKEAETLDGVIPILFSPEGLQEELEVEDESPDYLPPRLIEESVKQGKGMTLSHLPWLIHGHRYESEQSDVECEYCILKPDQVMPLHKDITQVMGLGATWRDPLALVTLDQQFVKVLERIAEKNKAMLGVLG